MKLRHSLYVLALALATVPSCSSKPKGPTREEVLPGLQQEAQVMKTEGEKMDPKLQVTNTWTITSVDVQEQAGNKAEPFRGTIKFDVETRTKEWDGTVLADKKQKTFNYAYQSSTKKWLMRP
jgi:uncharacterized protein (DUF2147 family)